MSYGKHVIIDGNSRDGALFSTGNKTFLGTRRIRGGKFEERKFAGKEWQVKQEWREWRDETVKKESIIVECRQKKQPQKPKKEEVPVAMAVKEQPTRQNEKSMFVLTFHGQRSTKNVALFDGEEAALRMASALTVALDASGMDGEYDVAELPVWQ